MDIEQLRRVIARWEERRLTQEPPTQSPNLIFQKHWYEQSKYHYSLRIVPIINIFEIEETD